MPNDRGPMTEAMYYVLLALRSPLHGYALMNAITEVSQGRIEIGPGTLYGVLSRMEKEKLIFLEEKDGRRKTYKLTDQGAAALKQEYIRLAALVRDGQKLLGEGDGDGQEPG